MTTDAAPTAGVPPEVRIDGRFLWSISIVAAMGGLLFGYDWVVIGGAKPFFEAYFGLVEEAARAWANSCALVGCLAGAMTAGTLADRFGRKRPLIASALLFVATSIGTGLAGTFNVFWVWRMLGGVAIGLASGLSPMYIAEVAPAAVRGRLVAVNQLTIVIGVLLAQVANWAIGDLVGGGLPADATSETIRAHWNGTHGWRWMFAVTAVPAALFFGLALLVPESPRWLAVRGRADAARAVLRRLGGDAYASATLAEIDAAEREIRSTGLGDLLRPSVLRIVGLGVALAVFQQWCGINVIFNYAEEVFKAAGYGMDAFLFNVAVTGAVMLAFTFVALGTVDRVGRRPLLLVGSASLALTYLGLGACYHTRTTGLVPLTLVMTAIACYSFSLAPVVWVVIAEIFPNRIRGAAMSVAVSALWIGCFTLTYSFPFLHRGLGAAGTFWLYAGICVAGFLFVWRRLPETKGKSLEQIEVDLTR